MSLQEHDPHAILDSLGFIPYVAMSCTADQALEAGRNVVREVDEAMLALLAVRLKVVVDLIGPAKQELGRHPYDAEAHKAVEADRIALGEKLGLFKAQIQEFIGPVMRLAVEAQGGAVPSDEHQTARMYRQAPSGRVDGDMQPVDFVAFSDNRPAYLAQQTSPVE